MERLNTYKSKLILFPRIENKPKKGLIEDSTAEKLKSAAASSQVSGKVLPRDRPAKVDEFAKITDEDKNSKVYRTVRTLRVIKKYTGRRERRARLAEEAKQ